MSNTYDLTNAEHIVAFDRDCATACNAAVKQHTKLYGDAFSIATFFINWSNDRCLWGSGYHIYLTATARNTFKRYAVVDRQDILDLETKKEFRADAKVRLKQKWTIEDVPRFDLDF
jgi:hypothetical protein